MNKIKELKNSLYVGKLTQSDLIDAIDQAVEITKQEIVERLKKEIKQFKATYHTATSEDEHNRLLNKDFSILEHNQTIEKAIQIVKGE